MENGDKLNERKTKPRRGKKKRKDSDKFTDLIEECRREMELHEKMGVEIPGELWKEFEEIEDQIEEGNYSDTAERITSLMDKLRENKERKIGEFKQKVNEVLEFLRAHQIPSDECENALHLAENEQLGEAKRVWEEAREIVEGKIANLKKAMEEVKKTKELIEYTATHKIDINAEKEELAKAEEFLLHGKIEECLEVLVEVRRNCDEKLAHKFSEEIKKIEQMEGVVPGLREIIEKSRAEFEKLDYYNAFGSLASAWSSISRVDINTLKAQIADLKILLNEIKTLSGYLPHLEDCEKELGKKNTEAALRIISNLRQETMPVFERDFGRIMSRVQAITQTLGEHGIVPKEVEERTTETLNYKAKGEPGKAILTARLAQEMAEKAAGEVVKNLLKSMRELGKAKVIQSVNLQQIKKIEENLGTNVHDALKQAFELKQTVDNEIRNQIEPVENELVALENLIRDLQQNGLNVSEASALQLKTRSFLESYQFKYADQTLNDLKASVHKLIAGAVSGNLPMLQKDIQATGDEALATLAEEVKAALDGGDFYTAWEQLKELILRTREVVTRSVSEGLRNLSDLVTEFGKSGIKFVMPEISPSDPLAREKIENFVSVCEDTLHEIVAAKLENAKKLLENAEKMGVKTGIDAGLIAALSEMLGRKMFNLESAKTVGNLNERITEAEKKLAEIALREIEKMEEAREKVVKLGFNTEKYDTKVNLAHERIEKGRLYEAWFVASRVTAEMNKDLHEKFTNELEYTSRVVKEFSKLDVDTIAIKVDMENAKILLTKKDYIKLRQVLATIQEKLGEFTASRVKEEFAKLEEYVETCIKFEIVPQEYRTVLHGIQSLINENRIFDAHMQIKEARDFLQRTSANAYETKKASINKLSEFGKKLGLDKIDVNFAEIDGVFQEDMVLGLEQLASVREKILKVLKDRVSAEISTIKRQFQVCRERGINCESQSMMVDDAVRLLEHGKIEEGYTLVLEAKASLLTVLEDAILKRLEEVKPEIELLKKHNLYSHTLETKLNDVQDLMAKKDIARAYATYFSLRTELDSLLGRVLSEVIEHYRKKLREYENFGFRFETEHQMLSDAASKGEKGLVREAYEEIGQLDTRIQDAVRNQIVQMLEDAKANLPIIEKEVIDAARFGTILERTENYLASGNLLGAIKSLNEFGEAYAKLKERFYDYIEEIREGNQILVEMGMAVQNLETEIEDFERRIDQHKFWEIAQRIIEWQIYLRGVLRDRFLWEINETSKALEQMEKLAGGGDEKISALLKEATVMVEEHRYGEARVNIAKAKSALAERNRNVFEKAYNELMMEIEACNGAGIDTTQAQRFLENFRAETAAMNYYAAKWNLENAKEALVKEEEAAATQAVHLLSTNLEPYSNIFPDEFVKFYKQLEHALVLFKERKYVECTKIAYKTNFEFTTAVSEKIRTTIEYTRKLIEDFTERGVDLEVARNLLNESIYYFNSSDFISAVQKANEARAAAEDYIKVHIQQRFGEVINLVRECTTLGVDTRKVDEEITKAEKLMEAQKYIETYFTLNGAHLECITQMQKAIQAKITEMEKLAQEFVSNGMFIPNEVYLYIERAKYSTSYGQFIQAAQEIEIARKTLLDILGSLAADRILAVKKIGDMGISIGCPMKNTLKSYQELTDAIAKIEVSKALELCRNIEPDAWKELYDYLQSIIWEINVLIQMAEEYGIPHATISESISQAEMHASWHNYPAAHQILTNAKKVLSDLLASALESALRGMKSVFEALNEILDAKLDMDEVKLCARDIERLKLPEAHMRLKKITEIAEKTATKNERKLREFVEEKFKYGKGFVDEFVKLGRDAGELQDLLAKVEERRLNKDYLNAAVKMNLFLKTLDKQVEIQFINARADLEQKFRVAREMEIDVEEKEKTYAALIPNARTTEEKMKVIAKVVEFSDEIAKQGLAYVEAKLKSYIDLNKNLTPENRLKVDTVRSHLEKKEMIEAYAALKTLK
ncbi:MAG: hypothetical protein N3F63_03070 [Thermoplasmata archaeon]|nr:hypothetical protein [Thermoplasmata archaeon]